MVALRRSQRRPCRSRENFNLFAMEIFPQINNQKIPSILSKHVAATDSREQIKR